MRNIKTVLAAIVLICLLINSCKEVGPVVPWGNGTSSADTTYIENPAQNPEAKNVLIEMFTGVQCINCPSGDAVLDTLISQYNPQVIGICLHSTSEPVSQDNPLPVSLQQLGTADAQSILNYFGDPGVRPEGSVDRIYHANAAFGPSIYDSRNNWLGYVQTELTVATPVNLILTGTYSAAGSQKNLTIVAELHYTSAQPDSDKLSIFLTEDSVVTAQLLATGAVDTFYVHDHIFRDAVTNPLGDPVNASLVKGTVVRKTYQYIFPSTSSLWNPAHMHIVAFVHKYENSLANILQTKIINVTQ